VALALLAIGWPWHWYCGIRPWPKL